MPRHTPGRSPRGLQQGQPGNDHPAVPHRSPRRGSLRPCARSPSSHPCAVSVTTPAPAVRRVARSAEKRDPLADRVPILLLATAALLAQMDPFPPKAGWNSHALRRCERRFARYLSECNRGRPKPGWSQNPIGVATARDTRRCQARHQQPAPSIRGSSLATARHRRQVVRLWVCLEIRRIAGRFSALALPYIYLSAINATNSLGVLSSAYSALSLETCFPFGDNSRPLRE